VQGIPCVCDSIEALEDRSSDGENLGGLIRESWKKCLTVAAAMILAVMDQGLVAELRRSLGWGLAGRLECNLTAWLRENRPMSRGTGYQAIRALTACQ
jgi:hypothetical protein